MARPQWRLLFQGGLGYTFDGMDAALVAFILPSATAVFSLSSSQTGLLGSSVLIGYLFGALSAGILGDLIGRKRVMMYALAIYATASLVAALSPSWGFLFWSRVVAGFGTGAESVPLRLPAVPFEVGVIAGARRLMPPLARNPFPGPNDGKVAASAKSLYGSEIVYAELPAAK